jgi:hypothetical protein
MAAPRRRSLSPASQPIACAPGRAPGPDGLHEQNVGKARDHEARAQLVLEGLEPDQLKRRLQQVRVRLLEPHVYEWRHERDQRLGRRRVEGERAGGDLRERAVATMPHRRSGDP